MSESTPGRAAYEAMHASREGRDPKGGHVPWEGLDVAVARDFGALRREDMEAAGQAAVAVSGRLADAERQRDHWQAEAASWQRRADALGRALDAIGVLAANAPEDGDSFGLLEEIAMRIAAVGAPELEPSLAEETGAAAETGTERQAS